MSKTKTKNTGAKTKSSTKSGTGTKAEDASIQKTKGTKTAGQSVPAVALSVFDPKRLRKFLRWLAKRHRAQKGVTEIRLISERPYKKVLSAYTDHEHVAAIVDKISPADDGPRAKLPYGEHPRDGEGQFYFTLNPVNPDLLSRSAHEFNTCPGTADSEVVAYSMVLIDIDTNRPSGVSATDQEKEAAWTVARMVTKYLRSRGIKPLVADSGNGWHLLIPTTRYKDVPAAAEKVHRFLKFLDGKFSTERAKIDTSVHNPSRICKLYGTRAVKGSDTVDRPHRYAAIDLSSIPDDVDLFRIFQEELKAGPPHYEVLTE